MAKVKVTMVLELHLDVPKKVSLEQVLTDLDYQITLPPESKASIAEWSLGNPIKDNLDIPELIAAAEESYTAWYDEENSVKEEHEETIERLRKALKQ
jgi:hypothetical protein